MHLSLDYDAAGRVASRSDSLFLFGGQPSVDDFAYDASTASAT
jgi:hypothetical protein